MKRRPQVLFLAAAALMAVFVFPVSVNASEGVFATGSTPFELGRASSGLASPRNGFWLYMNPASIVDLDRRFDMSMTGLLTGVKFKPRGIIGNQLDGDLESSRLFPIPSMSLVWPMENYTLGIGYFLPSGAGVEYPHSRTLLSRWGNADRTLYVQNHQIVGAIAHRFDNGWALGLNIHATLARLRTNHITLNLFPARADNAWDHALGCSLSLGVYKRWDKWSVAAVYNSRQWAQSFEKYDDLLRYTFDLPQVIHLGVAYRATPELEFTLDGRWLNWKGIAYFGNTMGQNSLNWDDQYSIKMGLEWKYSDRLALMCGYSYGNTPIDEDHLLLTALVPALVEHAVSIGAAYDWTEKVQYVFAVNYALPNTLHDTGRGDLFSLMGNNSELTSSGLYFSFGVGYKF